MNVLLLYQEVPCTIYKYSRTSEFAYKPRKANKIQEIGWSEFLRKVWVFSLSLLYLCSCCFLQLKLSFDIVAVKKYKDWAWIGLNSFIDWSLFILLNSMAWIGQLYILRCFVERMTIALCFKIFPPPLSFFMAIHNQATMRW